MLLILSMQPTLAYEIPAKPMNMDNLLKMKPAGFHMLILSGISDGKSAVMAGRKTARQDR